MPELRGFPFEERRALARRALQVSGPYFTDRGVANCVLAGLAESSEVLFDAQQDAASGRLYAWTLLLDIGPAGFAHRGDLHKRRLARLSEIIEMCISTFGKAVPFRPIGATKRHNAPTASLDDLDVLGKSRGNQQQYCKSQIESSQAGLRKFKRAASGCLDASAMAG